MSDARQKEVVKLYEGTGRAVVEQNGEVLAPAEVDKRRNALYQRQFYLKKRIAKMENLRDETGRFQKKLKPRANAKDVSELKAELVGTILSIQQLAGDGRGRPKQKKG